MQKYALIIAKNHEETLKKCSDKVNSWKRADWLYDGIAYKDGVTLEDLKQAVAGNAEFFPGIVIDNGAYLSAEKFSPQAWESNVFKFMDLTADISEISFYVLDLK